LDNLQREMRERETELRAEIDRLQRELAMARSS
jgi:hypothetical protein